VSGLATAVSAVAWLAGLAVLLRWPGRTIGVGAALVAWTWDPGGFWALLAVTWVASRLWGRYGPSERLLARFPELAVVLVAGVVAVLAGGQVAAGALAVLGLALGWFVAQRLVAFPDWFDGRHPERVPAVPPAPSPSDVQTPVGSGPLGEGAWLVQVGACPACGGRLAAAGREEARPGHGRLFVAHAACGGCGLELVGLGDTSDPAQGVVWIDPGDQWEQSA